MIKREQSLLKTLLTMSLTLIACSFVFNLTHVQAAAFTSNRIYGNDRYQTAAKIVETGWKSSSDYAIISTGEDFPDALCAAPLAKKYNAPIILTNTKYLNDSAKIELQRLSVKNVIIVGGTGVVSQNTENQIKSLGINTSRLAGNNRFQTSVKVAEQIGTTNQIVIATGADFPDALSIAPIAAIKGMPILLTDKNSLPNEIKQYLSGKSFTYSYVIGGTGVISDTVLSGLQNAKRLYGQNRYDTNISILNEFCGDLNLSDVYLATGDNFPDALTASALAPITSSPLVLIASNPSDLTKAYINKNSDSINNIVAVGGTGVVADSTLQNVSDNFGRIIKPNMGNTNGNIDNAGLVTEQGGWLYYVNKVDNYRLYKVKNDGTNRVKLTNDQAGYINSFGGHIYYINGAHSRGFSTTDLILGNIVEMNTDGTQKTTLFNGHVSNLIVNNDGIYFIDSTDNCMYRMGLDGKNIVKLSNDKVSHLNVDGKNLYYIDCSSTYNLTGKIYHLDITTGISNKISDLQINNLIENEYYLYFSAPDIKDPTINDLFRIKKDGSGKEKVFSSGYGGFPNFNVSDGNIYFTDWDTQKLSRIDENNLSNISIIDNHFGHINIAGTWVYHGDYKTNIFDSSKVSLQYFDTLNCKVFGGKIYYISFYPSSFEGVREINNDGTMQDYFEKPYNYTFSDYVVDGNNLYFTSYNYVNYSLNLLQSNSASPQKLVDNVQLHLAYSNGWIFYGQSGNLYKIRPDGTGNQLLSSKALNDVSKFTVNLANGYIYFSNNNGGLNRIDENGNGEISLPINYIYSVGLNLPIKDSNPTITENNIIYMQPQHTKDFLGFDYTYYNLYTSNLDGSNSKLLVDMDVDMFCTIGSKVYFASNDKIYSINPDGTGLTEVLTCDPILLFNYNGKLLFQNYYGVYEVNIDGTNQTSITSNNNTSFYSLN